MTRERVQTLIKILVSLTLLFILLRTAGVGETIERVRSAHVGYFLIALAIYLITLFVRGYRWQILLAAQHIRVPLPRLVYLYFVGSFFNIVLPSGMGGDVVKFYELARHAPEEMPHFRARVASSVLADRISGVVVLLLMGLSVVPFARAPLEPATVLLITALALGSMVAVVVLLNVRVRTWFERRIPGLEWLLEQRGISGLYTSLDAYTWSALFRAALVSLVFNALMIGLNVALGLTFGVHIPLSYYFVFVPIISLLLVIPLSINGFGLREGGYTALFGQAGVATSRALSMSLAFGAVVIITGLIGGLLYLGRNALTLGTQRAAAPGVEEPF